MIIVHDTFVCKPGNASKLAKLFKEWASQQKEVLHIMTDMTGQWHRIIVVSQYQNLSAYEKSWAKSMKDTPKNREMNKKFANMNDLYMSGSREIYKVW